ncbi:MAG: phytoene desaturase family protein [Candidatus Thorarchaeota archaeon]
MNDTDKNIIIVGAGIAGLTAAAYLSRAKYNVLLIEKNKEIGGLVNTIERDGFFFDTAARSIENSGIVRPFLNDLGIKLEINKSPISVGIESDVINIQSEESLDDYKKLLEKLYPEKIEDIQRIVSFMEKMMGDMAVLYGIDNPLLKDLKKDRKFLFKELLPYLGKFLLTVRRMNRLDEPVEEFLEKMSSYRPLTDIIDQHFFKNTPTSFAMGYFYVYLDYIYPKGGTGQIPRAIEQKIIEWGGKIQTETEISKIIPSLNQIMDINGNLYPYDYLIWCADLKTLYKRLNTDNLDDKISRKIKDQKEKFISHRGADSVFSLFIGVDEPLEKFKSISHGHFFYTPSKNGLGELNRSELRSLIENFENTPKEEILLWLDKFCKLNTYEISIPALRDPSLAPKGKTGLIVSILFEFDLFKKVQEASWYEEFKTEVENRILETLSSSIYPKIEEKILFRFSFTPLSILNRVGSSEGAIVGWSYEEPVPVVNSLLKIYSSVKTPIPKVLQGGQWTYSPAGIPIAILTGLLAAQKIIKNKI